MIIFERHDQYQFVKKETFTGSDGKLRFRLYKEKSEEEGTY